MRVAIGPSSFGEADSAPLEELRRHGVEVLPNPVGRRLTKEEIIDHLVGVDGLVAGLEPLSRDVLESAPRLRAIARVGAGLDTVDLAAAADLGIRVSSTPDAPVAAVAESTVAAMVVLSRSMLIASQALHDGRWEKTIGKSLSELSILVVGFGRIGRRVASLLAAFDAHVIVCDPLLDPSESSGIESVTIEDGLARADIVSLHAAGNATILDARAFGMMKRGVIVLNSGRGALIDEQSLVGALDAGTVSAAWLDVFGEEPYSGPLINYPQLLLTPHMATYTMRTRREMELEAVGHLLDDLGTRRSRA